MSGAEDAGGSETIAGPTGASHVAVRLASHRTGRAGIVDGRIAVGDDRGCSAVAVRVAPLTHTTRHVALLAHLLVDVVAHGGSVSFLHPLSIADATAFWDGALAAGRGERIVLGAWDGDLLVGTVSVLLDFPPNQPHRSEIAKMMTRVGHRGLGVATALMRVAEAMAAERGRTLLVLDTASIGGASHFYERLGFTLAGEIPDFAFLPVGGLSGTRLYWKRIGALAGAPSAREHTHADARVPRDEPRFRAAVPSDALCLGVLATQVFLDTYATDGIRPSIAREVQAQLSTKAFGSALAEARTRLVVAESAGHLIGFAQVALDATHVRVTSSRAALLERLYVQEAFAGRGTGSALLARAEAAAVAAGCDALWLAAWVGNARALAFYPRRGYEDVGPTLYEFENERHENRVYRKWLVPTG